jgi:hypothetical protein
LGDGCGNLLMCGSCDGGPTCGGGGIPYVCGGGGVCTKRTCAEADATCGLVGDGCGGILDCGGCDAGTSCGGGGTANSCGGGTPCVPKNCAAVGANCGLTGDGCGGQINCGPCLDGGSCGAGGLANVCGGSVACQPKTCGLLDAGCGAIGNGCGDILDCGGCDAGTTCGGGGAAYRCGARATCVPKTCAQLSANCGQMGDGCGGVIDGGCGTCQAPNLCGGQGLPNVCGTVAPDAGAPCTNFCTRQTTCTVGTTTLTGRVLAPTNAAAGYGNPDPIPGALVYVPNGTVQPFPDGGVTCDRCTSTVSGSPLISTTSSIDAGYFTLENVPCDNGADINLPVVIQLGKWRRQITVPRVNCCTQNTLTAEQTRLPRRQAEGHPNDNIPLIAIATGNADAIECVLPKIGVDFSQYSLPSGNGRVRFYRENGAHFSGPGGADAPPAGSNLFNSLTELKKYDMVILDCEGGENLKTTTQRSNLEKYANSGGRVFSSHFGYTWLFPQATNNGNNVTVPTSFTSTADWNVDQGDQGSLEAKIDVSFPKGRTFADWVQSVGAQGPSSTPAAPTIIVDEVRWDIDAVLPPAQRWVYRTETTCTPADCDNDLGYNCGRNLPDGCGGTMRCSTNNSSRCQNSGLNSQCGGNNGPGRCSLPLSTCVPTTCVGLGFQCGQFSDGCGGTLSCGTCGTGQACGAGGAAGRCAPIPQYPLEYTFNTPLDAGVGEQCGRVLFSDFHVFDAWPASDSTWPDHCPAGPMSPQEKVFEYLIFDLSSCIQPDVVPPQSCTARTCSQLGYSCGLQGNGCGVLQDCGQCTRPGETCGGGGTPGVCGAPCTPKSCQQSGFNCGAQGDGCGGSIDGGCGNCPSPQTCGGGGSPGVCGGGACAPKTCTQLGFNCGDQGNGCGSIQNCGTCQAPQACGAGGVPGVCGGGGSCTPLTCLQQGYTCGQQGNGCGALIDCGTCTVPGETCGGAGIPGKCGAGGSCAPRSCQQQNFNCGMQGDGCGNSQDCGLCPSGQICGAAAPGQCGAATCTPLTCERQNLNCGPAGDGCGREIDCGVCQSPATCGGAGIPGRCGTANCTPVTCSANGANCGFIADGCGSVLDCGNCTLPQTCGGGGIANNCGGGIN